MKAFFSFRKPFSLAVILSAALLLNSCKEEDEPKPVEEVKASATINESYNSFTIATYQVSQDANNNLINTLTFSRTNNSKIKLIFRGTEEGIFDLQNDTTAGCEFVDASQRVFQADTGKIVVSTLTIRDGRFTVSGGFEFIGHYPNPNGVPLRATIKNGGFVNISNN